MYTSYGSLFEYKVLADIHSHIVEFGYMPERINVSYKDYADLIMDDVLTLMPLYRHEDCHSMEIKGVRVIPTPSDESDSGEKILTRPEAIKRIDDIRHLIQTEHLDDMHPKIMPHMGTTGFSQYTGAIAELMAIFDIKKEELK